jgi:hypothetical protein
MNSKQQKYTSIAALAIGLRTSAALACSLILAATATAQTTTNLTLQPNYPGIQGASPLGVAGDAPAGWEDGSWQANVAVGAPGGSNFTSIILDPMTLFGRDDVRVDELARVTYYTKKDAPETAVDWFFQFYTKPYTGSPGAVWYGHRINAEPYFSESLIAPANQWNHWETDAGQDNRLRFYDSSENYFGSYTDPFLQDLATLTYPIPAWNLHDPYDDLGPQEVLYFNLGLGTGWAGGFEGQIDGIRIELIDGSVANINLENYNDQIVALNADAVCYDVNDTVTVTIDLTGNSFDEIVGGQFFLSYNPSVLQFVSANPGDPPFTVEIFEGQMPGLIDYAVGVPTPPGDGTTGDATMAVLTFTALVDDVCGVADLVTFRFNVPPTRLTDNFGSEVLPDLFDLDAITIDSTAPMFTFVPSNVTIECDAPTDPANTGGFATADDNCDPAPAITFSDDIDLSGCGGYTGTITRTWIATDACGNQASQDQIITIEDTTDPVFVNVPDDITVYADAGFCNAAVDVFATQTETFDQNPDLGVWVVDRKEPACFESVVFDGDNRLRLCIDASDADASPFHNTQGRKVDPLPQLMTSAEIDLYVPTDWATTNRRMAGFWLESDTGSFAIIEFNSGSPGFESTSDDPAGAGPPEPRFRAWSSAVGWVDMGLPTGFAFDQWYTLSMNIVGDNFTYEVGDLYLELPSLGSAYFDAVFIQGYNTPTAYTSGVTYEAHWDNLVQSNVPVALDNCDSAPVITFERDDNPALDLTDPFPAGITTITWTATDACGNFTTDTQTVEVIAENVMFVDVDLQGVVSGPFNRCIEFELTDANGNVITVVSEVLTFSGGFGTAMLTVPCSITGHGDCVMARDTLHTLRSTGDLSIVGTAYVADGFDPLRGGDLNDDGVIDILDFGVYVWQFGEDYGTGDTNCATPYPHADITGNGLVETADFTFISNQFLQTDDLCVITLMAGGHGVSIVPATPQPRTSITVRELYRMGLGDLAIADLNNDGIVDEQDIALFLAGVRP